ncbi:MAG: response regulator [Planctomycetes bacterium]|nr:response regulator [Planctomycetota bacterium]
MRALIIDDSRAMRRMLGNTITELGFEFSEAANGEEGLAELEALESPPELILVDWNMPRMDGLTFVKSARKRPEYSNCRILMVTTEWDIERMTAAMEAGADEYLMKPFEKEALVDKIQMVGLTPPNGGAGA